MKKNILKYAWILGLASVAVCGLPSCSKSSDSLTMSSTGKGGSMARFTIVGSYMFTVNNTELQVFDIRNAAAPERVNSISVGRGIETIMANGNYLYLGTQAGMYIYNIYNPVYPTLVSEYEHMQSCDPVAVSGTIAYLSLRTGTVCREVVESSVLQVVSIVDISNPTLIQELPLENPYGLAADGNWLFVCDGTAGLKIYDISTRENPQLVSVLNDIRPYDVIPQNGILTVVTREYVLQYDYTDIMNLVLLSRMQILS